MKYNWKNIAVMTLMSVSLSGCYSVDEGELAVRTSWGKANEDPEKSVKEPGLHGTWIIGKRTHYINIRTQKVIHKTESYTKDVQQADLQLTVTFRHKSDKAAVLATYKNYGNDWVNVFLIQNINQVLKDEIGHWEAADLVAGRDKATANIEKELKVFFTINGYPVVIESVKIDDISYKPEFEKAVEDKVIAKQKQLEEQNNTARIAELNKQTVSRANAEAEALNITGEAVRKNPSVINLKAIDKWDGKMPSVVGDGKMPFIINANQYTK